eukprot:jgi/Chlat1/4614/Chrsp293S04359
MAAAAAVGARAVGLAAESSGRATQPGARVLIAGTSRRRRTWRTTRRLGWWQLAERRVDGGAAFVVAGELPSPLRRSLQQRRHDYDYYDPEEAVARLLGFIEQLDDLVSFEDNYTKAGAIWGAIEDIPADKRHLLLERFDARQLERLWGMTEDRTNDEAIRAAIKSGVNVASTLPSFAATEPVLNEGTYDGVSPGVFPLVKRFQKQFFRTADGKQMYGRVILGFPGGRLLGEIAPLYFRVRRGVTITATDVAADICLVYGTGQLQLRPPDIPAGWPMPAPHLYPFNKGLRDYLRLVGPGVLIGQGWNEGGGVEDAWRELYSDAEPEPEEVVLQQHFSSPFLLVRQHR